MNDITYYLIRVFFLVCYFLLHIILTIVYLGKKKTVPPARNPILFKSATTLAKEIREEKIKSEEVVQTYIDRILEVEPYINAVTENNFIGALREAREVDILIELGNLSKQELSSERPLLGVPFTVKCLYGVKGFKHTVGSLLFKDRIAEEDAKAVALLKNAGGIFLALTNSPEFGSLIETENHLYGRTCNPYDTSRTCGGSSGGEAALISAAGSVIGLGTDVYGSLRIPSNFCGIFAHKPTKGLISIDGTLPRTIPPLERYFHAGPMCRYSEDLITLMKILQTNINQAIPECPQVDFKKLKIYYQTSIKYSLMIDTDREITQAVWKATNYFKKKYDITVNKVDVPLINNSNTIFLNIFQSEIPSLEKFITDGKIENASAIKELILGLFGKSKYLLPSNIILGVTKVSHLWRVKDVSFYKNLLKELEEVFESLLDEHSVFLCPTGPTTAFYHNQIYTHYYSTMWTGVFNLLGLPVTQCPIGISSNGLPIGMQIVSRLGNDALTIACAKELEKAFGGWISPQ